MKDYVNYARKDEPKQGVLFVDFVEQTVSRKHRRYKASYPRNYATLIYHVKQFCDLNNAVIYTNSVNEEFLDDFIVYLESFNLKKTYIKSLLTATKAMVRKAAHYGYAVDFSYDDVDIDDEEVPTIYLSQNDIARIYYFQGLTRKQTEIRDMFVVGCYTALRYSDLNTLSKNDFKDGFITKITKKTGVKVVIPIHDFVQDIYDKYDGNLPVGRTSQHFNRYIKMICRKIGFNDEVYLTYTRGGEVVTDVKQKWELISTHTARRSGATNLMKTGRMRIHDIMRVTGHASEKSFLRYIRTTVEDTAKLLSGDNFFRK